MCCYKLGTVHHQQTLQPTTDMTTNNNMSDNLHVLRDALFSHSRSGTPNSYTASLPPTSEHSGFHESHDFNRSVSPYYNYVPSGAAFPGSGHPVPEFHTRSGYLRHADSFGSGRSSQSQRSSDRLSSGSQSTRQSADIQELQMEVALLRSENQIIKTEKETILYVITDLNIFLQTLTRLSSGMHSKYFVAPHKSHQIF